MSDDNFGPWIDWAGGECPVADGISWQVRFRNGKEVEKPSAASNYRWDHEPDELPHGDYDIIAYRVHLPADGLLRQAIEALRPFADFSIADNDGSVAGQIRIQPDAEHVMTRDELEELLRPSATIVASTGNMAFGGDRLAENKIVTVGDFRKARAVLTAYDKRGA